MKEKQRKALLRLRTNARQLARNFSNPICGLPAAGVCRPSLSPPLPPPHAHVRRLWKELDRCALEDDRACGRPTDRPPDMLLLLLLLLLLTEMALHTTQQLSLPLSVTPHAVDAALSSPSPPTNRNKAAAAPKDASTVQTSESLIQRGTKLRAGIGCSPIQASSRSLLSRNLALW